MRPLLLLFLSLALSFPASATISESHGYAQFGTLKYPASFSHFDWVNPDAPKGGTLRIMASGTFDTLNPYTFKGSSPISTAHFLQYGANELNEPLMVGTGAYDPSGDEPASSYGLIARSVEYSEDRSWVVFNLRPEARFHDGKPITAYDVAFSYRLLRSDVAERFGRYYCDDEYDLTPLRASGRRMVELGRSCVDPDFRGGSGMFLLWNALADYVLDHGIQILFGVASFHGTDIPMLAPSLSWLHHHHLAPADLRPRALPAGYHRMDLIPADRLDRREAMAGMPALIKAYLRLGGMVGEGAFIDRAFNTTDVFLLMDTGAMSAKHKQFYESRWQPQ